MRSFNIAWRSTLFAILAVVGFQLHSNAQCAGTNVTFSLQTGSWANEIDFSLVDENGIVIFNLDEYFGGTNSVLQNNAIYFFDICLMDGCYSVIMTDSFGDGWNGAVLSAGYAGSMTTIGTLQSGAYGVSYYGLNSEECGPEPIPGCTDPLATNYSPNATEDDGSCVYPEPCNGVEATLYVCTFSNGDNVNLDIYDSEGNSLISVNGLGNVAIEYFEICLDSTECYTAVMSNAAGQTGWYNGYFWINSGGWQIINEELDDNLTEESVTFSIGGTCPEPGCTDPAAVNYDPYASEDDGSCIYLEDCADNQVWINMTLGSWPEEVSWDIVQEEGGVILASEPYNYNTQSTEVFACLPDGCYLLNMFDSFGDGWNGAELTITANGQVIFAGGLTYGDYAPIVLSLNGDGCENVFVTGCTDSSATNYNPDATIDDGSCTYPIYGCTDPLATNYNPWATNDNGSCIYPVECGEGEVLASLYVCTFSNGQCVNLDITDSQGNSVMSVSGLGNVAIEYFDICLDPTECYTAVMTNSCGGTGWYNGYFWINMNGVQIIHEELDNNLTTETASFGTGCPSAGCTDPEALNYDPNAIEDDGSCEYSLECDSNLAIAYMSVGGWPEEVSWIIYGENMDGVWSSANYPSPEFTFNQGCLPDGCYTLEMYDSFGDGWNNNVLTIIVNEVAVWTGTLQSGSVGSVTFGVNTEGCVNNVAYGCTDPVALNYNPNATTDDGSCLYGNEGGCTDPAAINYNPFALFDDGSCIYDEECDGIEVSILMVTGQWGGEVSWEIEDEDGNVVASGSGYTNNQTYLSFACLDSACYTVNMMDSFGDGWNGGFITISIGNGIIASGSINDGTYGSLSFGLGVDCGPVDVAGCTDPAALNYNPDATSDDGSCIYPQDCDANAVLLIIETQTWGYEMSWELTDENGVVVASGGAYSSWSGYTEELCLEDGCYTMNMYDSWGDGWNGGYYMMIGGGQLYGEGTLLYGEYGMDLISINGDCAVAGCTDAAAINYNPNATVNDGSCIYNDGINADPLDFILPEVDLDLDFFPNPFEVSINWVVKNADPKEDLILEVHDALGRIVMSVNFGGEQEFRQDVVYMDGLESGMYYFTMRNGDRVHTERIVKQ